MALALILWLTATCAASPQMGVPRQDDHDTDDDEDYLPKPAEVVPVPEIPEPPVSIAAADAAYSIILRKCVTDAGLVRYQHLADEACIETLKVVVKSYARCALPDDPAARTALWLNAYNANAMLMACLASAKPDFTTVNDIEGFFDTTPIIVAGETMTLAALERNHLAAAGDARVLAALVRASASSPPLPQSPYNAAKLSDQLDQQCARWVAGNAARLDGDKLILNQFFDWHSDAFTGKPFGSAVAFLSRYAPAKSPLKTALARNPSPAIIYEPYRWELNAAALDETSPTP